MTDQTDTLATVVDAPQKFRYEVHVDGNVAGVTAYRDLEGHRIFYGTVVDSAFAGRGLGNILVRGALSDAVAKGRRIVPICPFVVKFLAKFDDFADHVDPVTPAAEQAVDGLRASLE